MALYQLLTQSSLQKFLSWPWEINHGDLPQLGYSDDPCQIIVHGGFGEADRMARLATRVPPHLYFGSILPESSPSEAFANLFTNENICSVSPLYDITTSVSESEQTGWDSCRAAGEADDEDFSPDKGARIPGDSPTVRCESSEDCPHDQYCLSLFRVRFPLRGFCFQGDIPN